jgi:hypothetical protein
MSLRDKAISIFGQILPSIEYRENLEPQLVVQNFIASGAGHLIQDNLELTELKLRILKPNFENANSFLNENVILNDPDLKWIYTFKAQNSKEHLLQSIHGYLDAQAFNQSFRESTLSCLEELFMNSTLDAPAEAKKLGYSLDNSRVHFSLSIKDSLCWLSCWDSYGALDVSKFVNRLNFVYQQGPGPAMNRGPGGAGLGCMILFENCMSLALASAPNLGTRFVCFLPVHSNGKRRASLKKSLHHFKINER